MATELISRQAALDKAYTAGHLKGLVPDYVIAAIPAVEAVPADMLRAAVNDIPHIGRLCLYKTAEGKCSREGGGEWCIYQMHTPCPHWRWRGASSAARSAILGGNK